MGVVGGGLIITGMEKNHDCLMGFEARWKQHSFMSRTMSYGSSTPEKRDHNRVFEERRSRVGEVDALNVGHHALHDLLL